MRDKAAENAARSAYSEIKLIDNRLPELGKCTGIIYEDDEIVVSFANIQEIVIGHGSGELLEFRL